jgi:hypothetical protein
MFYRRRDLLLWSELAPEIPCKKISTFIFSREAGASWNKRLKGLRIAPTRNLDSLFLMTLTQQGNNRRVRSSLSAKSVSH